MLNTSVTSIQLSPLANPPVYSPTRTPSPCLPNHNGGSRPITGKTPRRASTHLPRSSISPMIANPPLSHTHPTSNNTTTSTSNPSPPLSRSHPLLGSYPLSLLHSRMSHAHAPHSLPSTATSGFALHLGSLGKGKSCPPELRCPRHLVLPFMATYYDLEDLSKGYHHGGGVGKGAAQTPWVGTIDIEQHYFRSYSSSSSSNASSSSYSTTTTTFNSHHGTNSQPEPPCHPGYRVSPVGQLQILIKTPSQAIKVFLIPYDLRHLPLGGRLLARERTYVQSLHQSGHRGESLRYAFQLQFICVASNVGDSVQKRIVRDSSTTRRRKGMSESESDPSSSRCSTPTPTDSSYSSRNHHNSVTKTNDLDGKAYYVSKSIKVIFTSSSLEKDEVFRIERTDEVVLPSEDIGGTRGRVIGFSPGSMGKRMDDWEMVRRKWMARKELEEIQIQQEEQNQQQHQRHVLSPQHSPAKSISPLPVLSPLPRLLVSKQWSVSRPTTPTQAGSPQLPSVKTPNAQRYHRSNARRGSGSIQERELSEKLRAMNISAGME